jgi:hypothetical protein
MKNQSTIEWHLKKMGQAASGIQGIGMIMEAIMIEEGDANSKFPYKMNSFVGGALVDAVIILGAEAGHRHEVLEGLLFDKGGHNEADNRN